MHFGVVFIFVTFFWAVRSQSEESVLVYSTTDKIKKTFGNVEEAHRSSTRPAVTTRKEVGEDETNFRRNVSYDNEKTKENGATAFEILGKGSSEFSTNKAMSFEAESRDDQESKWGSREDDILEAANFGLRAMHDLYDVKEPKLYSMGLYLGAENPAKYVAAFNDQTKEARMLAKFGYAVLEGASMFVKKFPDMSRELPFAKDIPKTRLQRQCPRRGTPLCPPASLRYRTSDGSCNNLRNPWWGSAMSTMQRFLSPVYDDGIQSIRRSRNGNPLPSARRISDVIHEDRDIPLASVTHMLMQWGQFVDHDLTATGQSRGFNGSVPQCCLNLGVGFQPLEFMHPECLPITVDPQDSFFAHFGVRCLEFLRSGPAPREDCRFGAREQLTQVTSYLDASTVYSSNAFQSDNLRLFRNGLLQYGRIQSRRPLLPRQDSDLCKRGSLSTSCFRAGDGRLSEQPALTSIHVVFLRLHNRLATKLAALNPHWSDEKIFQETRKIVGAIVQHITYREFLPIVLGHQVTKVFDLEVLTKGYYDGYDPSINPTVANAFSTAAYRFGHSLVQHSFVRFDGTHRPFFNNVSIHDEFRNPENLETAGSVDRLLLGLVNQPSQKRDEFITDELTRHLFQTPGFPFGMDLASLNIQRGRDHGIPPYVDWREPCGLSPIRSFADLEKVMSPSIAIKFRALYSYVDDIDLYPAGLAENSVPGGLVGPTFACIIAQQFSNLRRGDRFWYENDKEENGFTPGQLQQIRRVTLSQVLCLTMDNIENIQPFVFLVADTIRNQRVSCDDELMTQFSLGPWMERPPEQRSQSSNTKKAERKTNDRVRGTTAKPATNKQNVKGNSKINTRDQTRILPQRTKPVKANINQHNRIVVKKPFGTPDNVTIVVQNNAVNSPVFVNDAIYGSYIQIQTTTEKPKDLPRPEYVTYQNTGQYNPLPPDQGSPNIPIHGPPPKPIPTVIPQRFGISQSTQGAYVPYAYDDPSNPNPLNYGYRPNYRPEQIVYDNFSPTSPRPTLYTYYTHVNQPVTTQIPVRQDEGYFVNQKLPYNGPPTQNYYQGSSPSAWMKNQPQFDSNYQYHSQKPLGDDTANSYPPYNENLNNRPGYLHQPIPSIIQNENVYSAQPQSNHDRNKPAGRPYNQEESATWKYSTVVNKEFSTSTNKPYGSQSTVPQSNNYQNRPVNKPYNEDDPDIYYKKPYDTTSSYTDRDTSYHPTLQKKPTDQNGLGSLPNVQSYRKEPIRDPTLSNPDEWSNVPSYQEGPTARPSSTTVNDASPYGKGSFQVASTSVQSDSGWTKVPSYQADLSKESSSYQQRPTVKPDRSASDSFYQTNPPNDHPTSNRPSSHKIDDVSPYRTGPIPPVQQWTKIPSEHASHASPRPTKVQSVSIVTESIETVRNPGTSGYRPQNKINAEIPRPLGPRPKEGTLENARKHGQYYYDKNVLHRYPENLEDGGIKNDHSVHESDTIYGKIREVVVDNETTVELNFSDPFTKAHVVQNDDTRFMTTPTIVIDDRDDDLEGAFSEDVESVTTSNASQKTNYWVNSEEDPRLSTLLEMPSITSDEIANAKELPKPLIRSRGFAF